MDDPFKSVRPQRETLNAGSRVERNRTINKIMQNVEPIFRVWYLGLVVEPATTVNIPVTYFCLFPRFTAGAGAGMVEIRFDIVLN